MVGRHPFPGPGLAIRILGEVTREQVKILQHADKIYIEEIRAAGLYDQISQAFVALLPIQAVGVQGDKRTYDQVSDEAVGFPLGRLLFVNTGRRPPSRSDGRLHDRRLVRVPASGLAKDLVEDHQRGQGC